MSYYVIDGALLSNIADAIRTKNGDAGLLTPSAMAAAITALEIGGSVEVGGSGDVNWGLELNSGTITPDVDLSNPQIQHGLSGKPKGYLIFQKNNTVDDTGLIFAFGYQYPRFNNSSGGRLDELTVIGRGTLVANAASFTADTTTFSPYTSSYNYPLTAGKTYYWIAWR